VRGQHILLWEDNLAVVHIVCNGSSRSPALMAELRRLWGFMAEHNITLLPRYIRSEDNPADFWSRWRDRSAWQLSIPLFTALQKRVGVPFTLDPFACRATALLNRYCSLRPDPGAYARDGFSVDWGGEHLWLNPPWELIPQTLFKLRTEGARGMLIAPYWPAQTWWPELLASTVAAFPLPTTLFCVLAMHDGVVEPLLHPSTLLFAFQVDGHLGL